MYLSLPLPDKRTRSFEVTVVHVDGSKLPTRYSVAVPIAGKVLMLPHHDWGVASNSRHSITQSMFRQV